MYRGSLSGREGVLVRVHDQCFTSEVLGSRCACYDSATRSDTKDLPTPKISVQSIPSGLAPVEDARDATTAAGDATARSSSTWPWRRCTRRAAPSSTFRKKAAGSASPTRLQVRPWRRRRRGWVGGWVGGGLGGQGGLIKGAVSWAGWQCPVCGASWEADF
jgi:hypothetical protein